MIDSSPLSVKSLDAAVSLRVGIVGRRKKSASLLAKQRKYQRAAGTQSSSFLVLVFSFGDHLTDLLATEGHHRHAGTWIDRTANEV